MAFGKPKRLIIEKGCEDEPLTCEIIQALKGVPSQESLHHTGQRLPRDSWVLRRHKGQILKPCPGTRNYLCCGYYVLNMVLGCPFQCTYCMLQDYLSGREITVFVNLHDALEQIRGFLKTRDGIVRIGTGELGDSLALEPRACLTEKLVGFFRHVPNAIVELKTKSDHVDFLLGLPHRGHTVISWSLSPPEVVQRAESGASPLAKRLEAARRCQEAGYPVGIHFDPVVWTEHWRDAYHELVQMLFKSLDPSRIIWISLGALRYPPSLHERLVSSGLGLGELVGGLDGKLRYLRPIRTRMFRDLAGWIRNLGGDVFVYLCMESPEIWMESMGWAPRSMADLDARFQKRIKAFWGRLETGRRRS